MRNLIIASVLSLGTAVSFGGAAEAAGITVQLGATPHHHVRVVEHHRHHRRHHCWTKKVITHHHGRRIVKTVKHCD